METEQPVQSTPAPVAPVLENAVSPLEDGGTLQDPNGKTAEEAPKSFFDNTTLLVLLAAVWVWFLFSMRKNKRRQQERQQELQKLCEGDHVVTIGRVHGIITKFDDKTFTIKPDHKKDYTMTFDREALLRVVREDEDGKDAGK